MISLCCCAVATGNAGVSKLADTCADGCETFFHVLGVGFGVADLMSVCAPKFGVVAGCDVASLVSRDVE